MFVDVVGIDSNRKFSGVGKLLPPLGYVNTSDH
jgi:hypothetical protein